MEFPGDPDIQSDALEGVRVVLPQHELLLGWRSFVKKRVSLRCCTNCQVRHSRYLGDLALLWVFDSLGNDLLLRTQLCLLLLLGNHFFGMLSVPSGFREQEEQPD